MGSVEPEPSAPNPPPPPTLPFLRTYPVIVLSSSSLTLIFMRSRALLM